MSKQWIGITIVVSIFCIMFFGMFWVLALSHSEFTIKIEMDDNTREYLISHDYCMTIFDEAEDFVFMGDCKYLNSTIIHFGYNNE